MLPHLLVDDTDSDRSLLPISVRSRSFRIEPIGTSFVVFVIDRY